MSTFIPLQRHLKYLNQNFQVFFQETPNFLRHDLNFCILLAVSARFFPPDCEELRSSPL